MKQLTEIEQVILESIRKVYCVDYTGTLDVEELKPVGYKVRLGIQNSERPITIMAELPLNKFLKFFVQELRDRHLNDVHYYTGYRVPPDDQCFDTSCACKHEDR